MADDLADRLKREAQRLGFDLVGIAPAVSPPGHPRYLDWLARGHDAGMSYLARHAEAKTHPARVFEPVRAVIMVGLIYGEPLPASPDPRLGQVARYARGEDYHALLWDRLGALLAWLQAEQPGAQGRAVADTAPLLERDFARLAGLGWIGKNTMLIHRRLGSFTVLGALLVDVELRPDPPQESGHCGTCTRCLDACPTDAFVAPYQLDARRCLSYWTIEHKGPFPLDVPPLDGWAFGCDICQDVCPWNRKAPIGQAPQLSALPEWTNPDLIAWLEADPAAFSRSLKGTALARTKRSGLLRNAATILGERQVEAAIPALLQTAEDHDPAIRLASEIALARIAQGRPPAPSSEEEGRPSDLATERTPIRTASE